MIDVWAPITRDTSSVFQAVVEAVTDGNGLLDVCICNLVNLLENANHPNVKEGRNFVTLRDVVEQVGKDAVRFMMLTRSNEAPLDFDLKQVLEQFGTTPFYVQYAHARALGITQHQIKLPGLSVDDLSLKKLMWPYLMMRRSSI